MLENKYLKYSPEITLEIFTLIINKLIKLYGESNRGYPFDGQTYDNFKGYHNFINIFNYKTNYNWSLDNNDQGHSKTTVQEILGYDPFVKEDFVLPEKWSPGTYVVCTRDYGAYLKVGDVAQIQDGAYKINEDCVDISKSVKNPCMPYKDSCKWFATKSEAEEFAKTLVDPIKDFIECEECNGTGEVMVGKLYPNGHTEVNEECPVCGGEGIIDKPKQPLKQAVHCTTQEEWDFVTEKLGNGGINWFKDRKWGDNKSFCISFENKNQSQTLDYYQKAGYQILSFQEWCDLNGHKMESNIDLTGRHLKALIDGPQLTTYKKGDIVEIFKKKSSNQYLVGEFGGVWWTYTTNNGTESQWELLPEDYKMEKEVKFEVGKWYKSTAEKNNRGGGTYYGKFLRYDNGKFTATWHSVGGYFTEQEYTFCNGYKWELMTDLSEIDQYLPDGHPDKIIYKDFKIGDYVVNLNPSISYRVNELCIVSKINKTHLACEDKPQNNSSMKPFKCFRHATPEEINNHLISIGQIPKEKYPFKPLKPGDLEWEIQVPQIKTHGIMARVNWKNKMILSIDDEELPMVDIIKTNSIKQLLNND